MSALIYILTKGNTASYWIGTFLFLFFWEQLTILLQML
jgi:hypothetical protein